jgi:hypothetical protein
MDDIGRLMESVGYLTSAVAFLAAEDKAKARDCLIKARRELNRVSAREDVTLITPRSAVG